MEDEGLPRAMPDIPLPPETDTRVPAQVDVAFEVVRWANMIQNPHISNVEGRDLEPKEKSVYEAGLEVLRLYLSGEMTFVEKSDAQICEHCETPEPVPVDVKTSP